MIQERLKHVANLRISNVDKKSIKGETEVRLCNYTDVYYNERITSSLDFMVATASVDQCAKFGLRPGDVVLTKDSETADDIGVSALVTEEVPSLVCGYHLAVVRAQPSRAHGGYLRWVLASRSSRERMSAAATGVTRFGLRAEAIADLKIPCPPIEVQRAIAEYLNRETTRIDDLVAARQRMLRLLDEHWQKIIDDTIWCDVHETVRLMHVVDRNRQVMYGIVLPGPDVGSGGIPIVKGGDVAQRRLTPEKLCKTTPGIEARYARARLHGGDLVFSIRGGIGDVAIVPDDLTGANITQDVARISPRKGIYSEWLTYALETSRVQNEAQSRVTGATIRGLNIWELERLEVPSVSSRRQKSDLGKLQADADRRESMRAALGAQISLLQERRQALITAAVTGQLDIPGAA